MSEELIKRAESDDWEKPDVNIRSSYFKRNPVKAIRAKCLDCCCGSFKEVEYCLVPKCPIYPFRLGKNPYRSKKEASPELTQKRKEAGKRLAAAKSQTKKPE